MPPLCTAFDCWVMGPLEIAFVVVAVSAITYGSGYTYGKRHIRYELNTGESAVRELLTEMLPAIVTTCLTTLRFPLELAAHR